MKHYHIKFQYADALSGWKVREQECVLYADNAYEARNKCIKLYGLGINCDYDIVSIEEIA